MSFVFPLGLLGLISVPVVLALHLLRERRRKFVVSNLTLWSFLEPEVRGPLPRRIPISWILLLDLLIATLFALALAQPTLEVNLPVRETHQIILLLDVSRSMNARDVLPSRFAQAQVEAITRLTGLGPKDTATMIAFGANSDVLGDTQRDDLETLIDQVRNTEAGSAGSDIRGAIATALASRIKDLPVDIYVLTDAAYPDPFDGEAAMLPEGVSLHWSLFGGQASNQAVLSLSIQPTASQEKQVFARFGNFGNTSARPLVTLSVDGVPIESTTLDLPPDSSVPQYWTISNDAKTVSVVLVGSDPLQVDNAAYEGVQADEIVQVGLISDGDHPVERALNAVPGVELQLLSPDEYLPGLPFDLTIFEGTLPEQWPEGAVFILDPPLGSDLVAISGSSKVVLPPVSSDHLWLDGVDLGGVRWGDLWTMDEVPAGFSSILHSGEAPLLLHRQGSSGSIGVLLADTGTGNLTRHPAFPILIANVVRSSGVESLPASINVQEGIPLPSADQYPKIRLTTPGGDVLEWDTRRPELWSEDLITGAYQLELVDRNGEAHNRILGVNAIHQEELDLRPGDWAQDIQTSQAEVDAEEIQEINLAPYLLGVAALILLWEAWLAWR